MAIGASTGGTEALQAILGPMPADAPGIVIVQHMAEGFGGLRRSVNAACRMDVREARDGDPVGPGVALIDANNRHLVVHRRGDSYEAKLLDGPLVSRHRPSVDVLFRSMAVAARRAASG
ncbi:MAG: CheB methylesterase domain-containing protein [Acidobacteriota bacterium]